MVDTGSLSIFIILIYIILHININIFSFILKNNKRYNFISMLELTKNYCYSFIYWILISYVLFIKDSLNFLPFDIFYNLIYSKFNTIYVFLLKGILNINDIYYFILNYFRYNYIYYYMKLDYTVWL